MTVGKPALKLEDVREKIAELSEEIVIGLKRRARYRLNNGIYTRQFFDGMTWIEYRLLKDQSTDSEFGRFLFQDQEPLLFSREQLPPSKIRRNPPVLGIERVKINIGNRIIRIYRDTIKKLCEPGEDENDYGEVTKLDVNNLLTLYERTCALGKEVAEIKIREHPEIVYLDRSDLIQRLRNPQVEERVIARALEAANRYGFPKLEIIPSFFRMIIDTTIDDEVEYVLRRKTRDKRPK